MKGGLSMKGWRAASAVKVRWRAASAVRFRMGDGGLHTGGILKIFFALIFNK